MIKDAIEFNLKYNLENITPSAFEVVKVKNKVNEIPGKPKKNFMQVLKRFFSNPVSVIALLLFLGILLAAIIIPYTTIYSSNENIAQYAKSGLGNSIKDQLATDTIVDKMMDQVDFNQLQVHSSEVNFTVLKRYPAIGMYLVRYNPWDLIRVFDKNAAGQSFLNHNSIIGTNQFGIDIWTRTWFGTWESIKLAFLVVIVITLVGVFLGGFIGMYAGSIVDIILVKIITIYQSIPPIFWYTFIATILPPGFGSLLIVFIITTWTSSVSLTRMYMWRYINSDFMKVAKTIGVSQFGRIFKHALPNFLGIISLSFVGSIPVIIEAEAALGFLGLSSNPNNASLGNVLNEMQHTISTGVIDNLWYLLLPTLIIFVISMSLHFVAIGISDAVDPKFKKR